MRKFIEDFIRLPKETRPVVLERMREDMKRDLQGVENFNLGLGKALEKD